LICVQMREPGSNRRPDQQLFLIERALLRALCQSGALAELSSQAGTQLQGYSWQGSDHQIIFEALLHIGSVGDRSLREQLAAQATRMGFPDINWSDYFLEPTGPTAGELKRSVMALVSELKAAAARER
jgi:hypothetical protein